MASAPSGTPKLKKKNLPKIEPGLYSKTTLNEQVVFAIHFLEQHGVAVTVEEVVSTCFRLFPQSFSLKHYTRWPDSALVIRRLNDAREKGFVKGTPQEGFALKYAGSKLAERTAKTLGLVKPTPVKKVSPAKPKAKKVTPLEGKQAAPKKPLKPVAKKTLPKSKPKTKIAKQVVKRIVEQKPPTSRKAVKKPVVQIPVVNKKVPVKAAVKQKAAKKVVKPKVLITQKVVGKQAAERPVVQKETAKPVSPKITKDKVRKARPVQVAMTLPPPEVLPVKKPAVTKKNKPAPQLTKLQAIQPEMIIPAKAVRAVAVPSASKEEKARAEKIIRAMERSDAFKLYQRNGNGSKPSEFDFRNMLFATMESSPETLVRNVNLFKGSAAIHNRQDLIKFLDECEANFAHLLKPSIRKISKKK
ncbi:MAG: hypothetical protein JNM55_07595 [Anaerolineales bacterium]|nr:hypothetical protein [Anaerolineales bacterium]